MRDLTRIVIKTPAQKSAASDAALDAWGDANRRSPTHGLAERIRAANKPPPASPEKRRAKRAAMAKRQRAITAARTRSVQRKPDVCRYFPHQGPRERARRMRQMAKAAARAPVGQARAA